MMKVDDHDERCQLTIDLSSETFKKFSAVVLYGTPALDGSHSAEYKFENVNNVEISCMTYILV